MSKQYGLIKRGKNETQPQAIKNVFVDSSDSDEGSTRKPRTNILSASQKKQAQKLQEEALAEDSKIFEYDEVYDEIAAKRNEAKLAKKTLEARTPKYITKLLETAEKRKKEHERRVERQVQKEREAEGEQFKDKESFVTSTYRKKLEEMKEAEEAEKREAYLENIGDVTKQQDLSGFYRHIYEQKMTTDTAIPALASVKEEVGKKKNYRKRKSSADQNESDQETKDPVQSNTDKKAHLISNLDADSDFSIDSDSEDDEKPKLVEPTKDEKKPELVEESTETKPQEETEAKPEEIEEIAVEPPKPKIDIWKKRTVGEVYDHALERYYQRKAEREQAA